MSTLEIRRHSHRKNTGGSQLSQAGVDAARTLGATLGPFTLVATSVSPRARETAVAMGFAVDQEIVPLLSDAAACKEIEASALDPNDPSSIFSGFGGLIATHGETWKYGRAVVALWRDLMTPLAPDGAALLIGHSGDIEIGLVTCFPDADHSAWGRTFAPLEGARLTFEGEPAHFTKVELLRQPG